MFLSGMKEAHNNLVQSSISPRSMELIKEYLYSDEVNFESITEDHALELLVHLNQIGLDRLKVITESKITEMLQNTNIRDSSGAIITVPAVLSVAEQHNCQRLLACCVYYYTRKYSSLKQ